MELAMTTKAEHRVEVTVRYFLVDIVTWSTSCLSFTESFIHGVIHVRLHSRNIQNSFKALLVTMAQAFDHHLCLPILGL